MLRCILLMLVFYVVFFISSCSQNDDNAVYGSGTLEATEVLVRAKSVGDIVSLAIDEGDYVEQDEVIAQVDTEKIVLQRQQLLAGLAELELNLQNAQRRIDLAEDQYANTKKKHARIRALYEQQSVTEQQMDDVDLALQAATTQLETARTQLEALYAKRSQLEAQLKLVQSQVNDATVRAPISGVVINKFVERGETVSSGSPIVNLANLRKMWIRVYLTTAEIGQVKLGSAARLKVDALPQKSFSGKVTYISSQAEFTPKNVQTREARADLVYAVKVEFVNTTGELKIGMPADVFFE